MSTVTTASDEVATGQVVALRLGSARMVSVALVVTAVGARLVGADNLRAGSLCPIRRFTGVPCPFCGGTTAIVRLTHGAFGAAFAASPAVLAFITAMVSPWLPANVRRAVHQTLQRMVPQRGTARVGLVVGIVIVLWGWQLRRFGLGPF